MLEFKATTQFSHDRKLAKKRGLDLSKLGAVIDLLLSEQRLPAECRDHVLVGPYFGKRECHIAPDWLFVYRITDGKLIAYRTGTHSDLFDE
jgi:mRNA interferase YafQ